MYSTLLTITPPALEPVTVETARKHCRIDNDDDDDLVAMYVQTARETAENFLSRALVTQTLRYVIGRNPYSGGWPMTLSAPLILPMWLPGLSFAQPIKLPRSPAQAVTAVTVGDVTLTTDGYSSDVANTPGRVLLGSGWQPQANQDVSITFVAGYGADPKLVPPSIRTAILFLTAWLYEHRGDEAMELPQTAYMLLTPHRLVDFGA